MPVASRQPRFTTIMTSVSWAVDSALARILKLPVIFE